MRRIYLGIAAAAVLLATGTLGVLALTDDDPAGGVDSGYEDPEGIKQAGTFNEEEWEDMAGYTSGPLLWLGEDFHGYQFEGFRVRAGFLHLTYGDCDAHKANPREPSCVDPLQMQLKPPGALPPVASLKPHGGEEFRIFETRGLQVYEQSTNLVVEFTNGYTLTIGNSIGDNEGLLAKLQSANHGALGFDPAGPGDDLDVFTAGR